MKQQNTQQMRQNTMRKIRKIIHKEFLINLELFKCVQVQKQDFRIAQKTVNSDFPFSREMGATAYTLIILTYSPIQSASVPCWLPNINLTSS